MPADAQPPRPMFSFFARRRAAAGELAPVACASWPQVIGAEYGAQRRRVFAACSELRTLKNLGGAPDRRRRAALGSERKRGGRTPQARALGGSLAPSVHLGEGATAAGQAMPDGAVGLRGPAGRARCRCC